MAPQQTVGAPTYAGECRNARRLQRVGLELVRARYAVIIPGWNVPHRDGLPWERWLQIDEELLSRADILYRVLPDPDGRVSLGAEREVATARRLGIPVAFDFADLHRAAVRVLNARSEAS